MKIIGKIFLLVAGILLLVAGVSTLIPTIKMVINASLDGNNVALFIINLCVGFFSVFAGLAGISCLFIATPKRVRRVVVYAILIAVLMVIDMTLNIVLLVSNGAGVQDIFKELWQYILGSGTALVYILGAIFLRASYKSLNAPVNPSK